LAECIVGLRRPTSGTIRIKDQPVTGVVCDPSLVGYIPADRQRRGLVLGFNVAENLVIKAFDGLPYTRRGILRWGEIDQQANAQIQQYHIRTPSPSVLARHLSGGNQQKVVVARELSGSPALLIASQPTRGLDVGSVEAVHNILLQERNRGAAVLFISTELSEVMSLSDRIVVLFRGAVMGDMDAETAELREIGELMLGRGRDIEVAEALTT
jgi:ABC-type uncharacterized transport system ATPase subunit